MACQKVANRTAAHPQTVRQHSYITAPVTSRLFNLNFFWGGGRYSPQWASTSSFTRFSDHTQRRTTVGRTPLDEWSVRRRDLYLTKHNNHMRQTSMPPGGIRTHDPSRRAAADIRLRPRGYRDRHSIWIDYSIFVEKSVNFNSPTQYLCFLLFCLHKILNIFMRLFSFRRGARFWMYHCHKIHSTRLTYHQSDGRNTVTLPLPR